MSQLPRFGLDRLSRRDREGDGPRPGGPGHLGPHHRPLDHDLGNVVKGALGWAAVVLVGIVVGVAANGGERLALALGGLLLILGLFVADPIVLAVLVLPGSLLLQRVGGAGTNLSVADLLVFMGALVCLFQVHWSEAPFLRQFFRSILWFQAILLLVVVANPNRYDIIEWFHRFSYLGGSVLVGWTIANYGRTRPALRLFLWGSAIVALISVEQALATHFQPAQWGGYQKNSIGAVMWVAVVVAQLRPAWTGLGRTEARVVKYVCFAGLLASQSRQAIISLILAIAVATFLNPDVRRRSKLVLLGCIPLVVGLYYSFSLAARDNPKFNSVSIRFGQIGDALHVWHQSPLLGEGMRFYNLPQYITVTAPPNVLVDNLASTGIVGSLAFFYLVFMTMRTMNRLPRVFGTLGLVILLGHYVDGLFDIFWIGANMIPPLLIAGMSLGAADADRVASGEVGTGARPDGRRAVLPVTTRPPRPTSPLGGVVHRARVALGEGYRRVSGFLPASGLP